MRLASTTPPPPKLEFGGMSAANDSQKALDPNRDDELWQRQQAILLSHRASLCFAAKSFAAGIASPNDVREVVDRVANKIHVADWNELVVEFDALKELGDEFHRGIFVLGGWHHTGNLPKLRPPPGDLLDVITTARVVLNASFLVGQLIKASPEKMGQAQKSLVDFLRKWPQVFQADISQKPDDLVKIIELKQKGLALTLETQLLFFQQRFFCFSPTAKSATAGWTDFYAFVRVYRTLMRRFTKQFPEYYWGIFLPRQ